MHIFPALTKPRRLLEALVVNLESRYGIEMKSICRVISKNKWHLAQPRSLLFEAATPEP